MSRRLPEPRSITDQNTVRYLSDLVRLLERELNGATQFNINDALDVSAGTVNEGEVLLYNSSNKKFEPKHNNAPALSLNLTSDVTVSANTTTAIVFDNAPLDTENSFNTSAGTWTPGIPGWYNVQLNVATSSAQNADSLEIFIKKDTSTVSRNLGYGQASGDDIDLVCQTLVELSASGTISFHVEHDVSGGAIVESTPGRTRANAFLVFRT